MAVSLADEYDLERTEMKILYARTQFWFDLMGGGSVAHTLGVLNGFRKNSCVVRIAGNEKFFGAEDFDFTLVKPLWKDRGWKGEFLHNLYAEKHYRNIINGFGPDFIYHRYTGNTYFVSKIARDMHIPLVLEFNSSCVWKNKFWSGNKNGLKMRFYRMLLERIEKFNLENASIITVVSTALKESLITAGIDEGKIFVNPNGVDPEEFNPGISRSEQCTDIREKSGISEDKTVVGFVGTFGEWHGIPELTSAIQSLNQLKCGEKFHFLLVGDGNLKKYAQDRLADAKNVTFTGLVPFDEVKYYLGACDILVAPHSPQVDGQEFFGSPTKLFEYMAMGKAIVASRLGQIGEILRDGESALMIEPGNVRDLVEKIAILSGDRELMAKLGNQAREFAVKCHSWQTHTFSLLREVEKLIGTP